MPSAYSELPTLGVSAALALCNSLLQTAPLAVEGEIANYTVSKGKFVFFDLKDLHEEARVGCFMMLFQQNVPLEDGMRVILQAQPGIYAKSGQFRLTIKHIQIQGEGGLKRAFELLKAKLAAEGLFAPVRKRTLPKYPQTIALISSSEAAGYSDFLRILQQRMPGVHILFANVAVQGINAEQEIVAAFDYINSHYTPEVIVLTRGGGSMEDLHAFNSEAVARAITRSKAPVLVGVGHERDVTIADFAADVRASTPSHAAQIVVPEAEEVQRQVAHSLAVQQQMMMQAVQRYSHMVETLQRSITTTLQQTIERARHQVQVLLETMNALAPTAVLQRGYSLTRDKNGTIILDAAQVHVDDILVTQFAKGSQTSRIINPL